MKKKKAVKNRFPLKIFEPHIGSFWCLTSSFVPNIPAYGIRNTLNFLIQFVNGSCLLFSKLSIIGIQYSNSYISLRCMILWFNIFIPYNLITPLLLVIICHHTNLSHYYWLYSCLLFWGILCSVNHACVTCLVNSNFCCT